MSDPNLPSAEPILEEETSALIRWWVQAASDRDCYDVYVVRYSMPNSITSARFYFSAPEPGSENPISGWIEYNENERIQPAYRFPGEILHIFAQVDWIDRGELAVSLRQMASTILQGVAKRLEEDAN